MRAPSLSLPKLVSKVAILAIAFICSFDVGSVIAASISSSSSASSSSTTNKRQYGVLEWNNATWEDDGTAQIPLGNGDVTAGVWVTNTTTSSSRGDLRMLVSSSTAFDENSQPVRIGVFRLTLDPPLLSNNNHHFKQTFDPATASLTITTSYYRVRIFVDATAPLLRVSIQTKNTGDRFSIITTLEPYRQNEQSQLGWRYCAPRWDHADTIVVDDGDSEAYPDLPPELQASRGAVTWFHDNSLSWNNPTIYEATMRNQGLDPTQFVDPYHRRVFGGSLYGRHGILKPSSSNPLMLLGNDLASADIHVAVHTTIPTTKATTTTSTDQNRNQSNVPTWLQGMASVVASHPIPSSTEASKAVWQKHSLQWADLWNRSYLVLSPRITPDTTHQTNQMEELVIMDLINDHYVWDRYLTLIQGRGASAPVKFNGQAFTANTTGKGWDYRMWGSCYWWQNTRQPYYNSLMDGDVEVLDRLITFYQAMLPSVQARTYAQFQHTDQKIPIEAGAAFYPETTTSFGTFSMADWECKGPVSRPYGGGADLYIQFHWTGGLELCLFILDRYEWTDDLKTLKQHMPVINGVLAAFMSRYPIQHQSDQALIDIFPAQSLETWQCPNPEDRYACVTNPTPDVAGLQAVLSRVVALPAVVANSADFINYVDYLAVLPAIPTGSFNGSTIIRPGQRLPAKSSNTENAELYAVHPFRMYGVDSTHTDLATAQATFHHRTFPCNVGWCQDVIHASMLNLTFSLVSQVIERATMGSDRSFRFPGFASRNQDYEPSLDHFSTLRTALNYMLLGHPSMGGGSSKKGSFLLFPGFPSDVWDVDFKLHGPHRTTIEARCHGGKVTYLHVDPPDQAWRIRGTGNCRIEGTLSKEEE